MGFAQFPERREHPRVSVNIPIKIQQEDGDIVTETKNISRSGAYCKINHYVKPMTKLMINLLIPIKKKGKNITKKVSCSGVVVRAEPIAGENFYHAAIFFNDLSAQDADCITEYVKYYLEKP